MKKVVIGMVIMLLVSSLPVSAETHNFLKEGYSFFDGDFMGAVGMLEPLQPEDPAIDFDFDSYEVTWTALEMEITNLSEIGPMQTFTLTGGAIALYEDASFDLDYGVAIATGIATASNGTAVLTGAIYGATFMYNTLTKTGSFLGSFYFDGGTRLGELGTLADYEWAIFNGASGDDAVNVPPGYHSRFAGRLYNTDAVPVMNTTISNIHLLY